MSFVEIRDHALWAKHIFDNEPLKSKIVALKAGDFIELEVNGYRGMWQKMDDGSDGRPTLGIKALGSARERWHDLQSKRGTQVSIKIA